MIDATQMQEYEGRHCDVTITPWKEEENMLSSFAKMLKNVSTDEFLVMTIVRRGWLAWGGSFLDNGWEGGGGGTWGG